MSCLGWLGTAHVRPHVSGYHVTAAGGVRACRAPVGFLPGVSSLMGSQMIRARKYLSTGWARVGLYSSMQTGMPREHVRSSEFPWTYLAFVRSNGLGLISVTGGDVFSETIVNCKGLATRITRVDWLRCRYSMLRFETQIQRGIVVFFR